MKYIVFSVGSSGDLLIKMELEIQFSFLLKIKLQIWIFFWMICKEDYKQKGGFSELIEG